MKILLANAPWHNVEDECGWLGIRAGSRWPHTVKYMGSMISSYLPFPFYLATASTLLKREGFKEIKIIDSIAQGQSYEEFYDEFTKYSPDFLVMETSTPSLSNDLRIAKEIKKIKSDTKVVFCGVHYELEDESFLKNHEEIEYLIYGEYEYPLLCLVQAIQNKESFDELFNLLYRNENGEIIKKGRGPLYDINELPWPERDELPKTYADRVCGLETPQLQIHTGRGCPYSCVFCVWPQIMYGGPKYRRRNAEDVVAEIRENLKKCSYKSVYIDDDTFNLSKEHVLELCKLFKEHGIDKIHWAAMGRGDLMDKETLLALEDAGLYAIKYGVESFNKEILNNIGKNMNLEKNIENIRLTKELGINVHLTFCLGLPGDTKDTIENTIDEAMKLPFDTIQFSIATPYPGCTMYEMYDEKGWIITKDWDMYNGTSSATISTDTVKAHELEQYIEIAYKKAKEKPIIDNLSCEKFKNRLQEYIREEAVKKVLVFHSAILPLTREIINQFKELNLDIHILSNKTYHSEFLDLSNKDNIHYFDKGMNFDINTMKKEISTIKNCYKFDRIIIPYSNCDRIGYENVHEVASYFGIPIIGITKEGDIFYDEKL